MRRLAAASIVLAALLFVAANRPAITLLSGDSAVYYDASGNTVMSLAADTGLLSLRAVTADAASESLTNAGDSVTVTRIVGDTDPSAGGGVTANAGSIYQRNAAGADGGQAWLKTADADTAWSQIATSAGSLPAWVARADYIRGGAAGWERAAGGGAGTILRFDGTDLTNSTATYPNTATRGSILIASASNVISALTVGSAGKLVRSDGTDSLFSTFTIPDTFARGTFPVASAANVLSAVGPGSAGAFPRSDATDIVMSTLLLPNALTSGGVLYGSAANTAASSGALAQYAPVVGGGAGAAPATITAGSTGQFLGGATGANPAFTADVVPTGRIGSVAVTTVTADDGAGTQPSISLQPAASVYLEQCDDTNGCTLSMSETSAIEGTFVMILSTGSGAVYVQDSSGVSELDLNDVQILQPGQAITLLYGNAAWRQVGKVSAN